MYVWCQFLLVKKKEKFYTDRLAYLTIRKTNKIFCTQSTHNYKTLYHNYGGLKCDAHIHTYMYTHYVYCGFSAAVPVEMSV